jgi:hypothetical protein
MSWKKMSEMVRRLEFVKLALRGQQNISQLCRRYRISRKTGYKWKARFEEDGQRGLRDRSRRPHRSPQQVAGNGCSGFGGCGGGTEAGEAKNCMLVCASNIHVKNCLRFERWRTG